MSWLQTSCWRVTRLHGKAEAGSECTRPRHLGVLTVQGGSVLATIATPETHSESYRLSCLCPARSLGGIVCGPWNRALLCRSASLFSSMKWEQSRASHRALVGLSKGQLPRTSGFWELDRREHRAWMPMWGWGAGWKLLTCLSPRPRGGCSSYLCRLYPDISF